MEDELKSKEELVLELAGYRRQAAHNLNEIRLHALFKLSQMQEKSLQEILDFALDEAITLTDSKIGYIYFYDEDAELFTLYSWSSSAMAQCAILGEQTLNQLDKIGLWGEAVRQRQAIITNNYHAPNPYKRGYPEGHVHLTRHMNLPIFINKKIVAVIGVGNKETDYSEDDVIQLRLFMEGLWNIAERIRIEAELKKSEEKFRTIADFTHDWEYWIAPNKEILYCSPSCLRMTGYAPEEFMNDRNLMASLVHPEDAKAYSEHIEEIEDQNQEGSELTFRIISKTGEEKWIGHVCRQVFANDGAFLGRRASNRDVNDRMTGELLLLQSSVEIKRLDENILNMLKVVSHDIRSPLLSMYATLKLLQRGRYGHMDDSVANTVIDLLVRVQQLLGIADDCLGKAHAVDAHMKIEKEEIDLRQDVIETVFEELANEIVANRITIDNRLGSIPTGAIVVNASKIWLKAVYRNIFNNAIKYGGKGCRIAFGYEEQESFYRLIVYNSGTPIPQERRGTLFTRFGRVGEDAIQEGVGMGLFLTKEIINQHGGDIWYEAMGDGSAFIFTLPKSEIEISSPHP